MRIDQIMAGYADGDAISKMAVQMRAIFREWGYESDIFVDPAFVSPTLKGDSYSLADYNGTATDIAFHHFGVMSVAAELFGEIAAHRIMIYHNITPPHWFRGFDDALSRRLQLALDALPGIAANADEVWTVSGFNAGELAEAGIAGVKLLPLPFSPIEDSVPVTLPYDEPLTNILFVGRIAPNKRLEDLLEAFAWYHFTVNRQSRLFVIGSTWSCPRYYSLLRLLVGDLSLENVCFEGFVANEHLPAYYRLADLYVSPSLHEGYCLPLVEAMHYDIPVIARAVGGTPEAMDGAGVLYEDLDNAELGLLFGRVLGDMALKNEIQVAQRARVGRALQRDLAAEIRRLLGTKLV